MENEKIKDIEVKNKVEEKKESEKKVERESPLKRLVPPHNKKSRVVTEEDVERLVEEARILHAICFESSEGYSGAYAMHHAQIDDKDPLNFFVTGSAEIIINPVIVKHSNYTNDSNEGCVTYLGQKQVVVQRWQKIDVEYVTIMTHPENPDKFKLSSKIEKHYSGLEAKVFQHEYDHGNAKYIYNLQDDIKTDK